MRLVFVSDHRGLAGISSPVLRPLHIGAASYPESQSTAERDDLAPDSISSVHGFADVRAYHHVARAYAGKLDAVGFMQYRRALVIGDPDPADPELARVLRAAEETSAHQIEVSHTVFERYGEHLKSQTADQIFGALDEVDFVVNKAIHHADESLDSRYLTVESQYLLSICETYPGDDRYVAAWMAVRAALERKLGRETLEHYLASDYGYYNNSFLCRWSDFEDYNRFLFEMLDAAAAWRDLYRVFGYIAERVFTCYIRHLQDTRPDFRIREVAMLFAGDRTRLRGPSQTEATEAGLLVSLAGSTLAFARPEEAGAVTFARSQIVAPLSGEQPVAFDIRTDGEKLARFGFRLWSAGATPVTVVIEAGWGGRAAAVLTPDRKFWSVAILSGVLGPPGEAVGRLTLSIEADDGATAPAGSHVVIDRIHIAELDDEEAGREPATWPTFRPDDYVAANPDLIEADARGGFDPLEHFTCQGFVEARLMRPLQQAMDH